MTVKMEPTKEQIRNWIENFVPKKDLFFVEEKTINFLAEYLSDVLVVPREEFFGHSSYKQIQLVNSYMYWNISEKVKFVIVAQSDWITKLPEQIKRKVLFNQFKVGRGLIFPLSLFSFASSLPEEYIVEENGEKSLVIQHNIWNELPYQLKENAIKAYAQLWDNWICCDVPEQTPIHIQKYANNFSPESGSNCLSATLFAITEQDWIVREWVHPNTFLNGLERANFSLTNDDVKKGDVVTWVNNDGIIQHATYHIDNNLFFNKNGQTFFNPWKITHWNQLNEEWCEYKIKVYRKS
ncbi:hypothetical protein F0342_24270 [Bacillus sp. CH30_1T]|uniref:hypothetical protein n=1 Tax=Bacillus sp. CH30_1T TaxID=2604836 RepID=UPI0011F09155|nr:hypothetical protein [Bacillus sp. CH30_1T]KAA0560127.1 hypothetical protein F0342_24270 [Bacillus sp. CH30_1T]